MKNSTIRFIGAVALLGFAILSGCKKSSLNDNPGKGNQDTTTINTGSFVNPHTAPAICDYDFNDADLTNNGWKKTFEDNFNGDLSNWSILKGGVQNELQCYQAANLTVANGVLQINAKKENITGPTFVGSSSTSSFNYTSGWITSKSSISASDATPKVRIVARIKLATGYGLTSVFWCYGGNWPVGGEIDFIEAEGNTNKIYSTDYFYGTAPGQNLAGGSFLKNPTTEDLSQCYHVYEMEWSKQALTSYLDGKVVETKTAGNHVPDLYGKQMYISLNLSVGGIYYKDFDASKVQTGSMYVDYVKVFTSN